MVFSCEDQCEAHLAVDHFYSLLEPLVVAAQGKAGAAGQLDCPKSGCALRFPSVIEAVRHLGRHIPSSESSL
jgi:hypothetical protein